MRCQRVLVPDDVYFRHTCILSPPKVIASSTLQGYFPVSTLLLACRRKTHTHTQHTHTCTLEAQARGIYSHLSVQQFQDGWISDLKVREILQWNSSN